MKIKCYPSGNQLLLHAEMQTRGQSWLNQINIPAFTHYSFCEIIQLKPTTRGRAKGNLYVHTRPPLNHNGKDFLELLLYTEKHRLSTDLQCSFAHLPLHQRLFYFLTSLHFLNGPLLHYPLLAFSTHRGCDGVTFRNTICRQIFKLRNAKAVHPPQLLFCILCLWPGVSEGA